MSISRCIKLCLIALVVLLFACTSGEPIGFENQAERGVSLLTFANGDEFAQAAAQAPVALEINVLVDAIPALVVAAGGSARLANQVEIRLQEDGQWLDVTALYKSCWSDSSQFIDGKFTQSFTATLDQADEYLISARVEYFDGIVLQTDDLRSHLLTVTAPTEPEDGQPSGEEGFDEQDEWVIRDFTDPRDNATYEIIDGRALVAFFMPVDMDAAWQFVADEKLDILSEWWMIGSISVLLPEGTSVEEAVGDWPDEYPELIEAVDPDAVVGAD